MAESPASLSGRLGTPRTSTCDACLRDGGDDERQLAGPRNDGAHGIGPIAGTLDHIADRHAAEAVEAELNAQGRGGHRFERTTGPEKRPSALAHRARGAGDAARA